MRHERGDPDCAADLEHAMAEFAADDFAERQFLQALSAASLWIVADKDHSASRQWHPDTSMLFLGDDDDSIMLAVFTSPRYVMPWCDRVPDFAYGVMLDFSWILARLPANAGLILNPASDLETRVTPAQLDAFKPRH